MRSGCSLLSPFLEALRHGVGQEVLRLALSCKDGAQLSGWQGWHSISAFPWELLLRLV